MNESVIMEQLKLNQILLDFSETDCGSQVLHKDAKRYLKVSTDILKLTNTTIFINQYQHLVVLMNEKDLNPFFEWRNSTIEMIEDEVRFNDAQEDPWFESGKQEGLLTYYIAFDALDTSDYNYRSFFLPIAIVMVVTILISAYAFFTFFQ